MPQNNFGPILEKLGELSGEVKGLTKVVENAHGESDKKFTIIFKMLNSETPCVIGETAKDAESSLRYHKKNHMSWLKMLGVGLGVVGGALALWDRFSK